MTSEGKLCSAPDVRVTSKGDCQAAAKTLNANFRGTSLLLAFAQKGCIMCFTKDCYTKAFTEDPKGVWWNPYGMDKQFDVQFKKARSICIGK